MLKVIGNNQWGSWSSQNLGTKKHPQDTKSDEVQVQVASKPTCPSADQAKDVHWGGSALLLVVMTSCLSSSTMIFPSKSCREREPKI